MTHQKSQIDEYVYLMNLIENSMTISEDEKEFWLDILPTLSKENLDKLLHIIMEEERLIEQLNAWIDELRSNYIPHQR